MTKEERLIEKCQSGERTKENSRICKKPQLLAIRRFSRLQFLLAFCLSLTAQTDEADQLSRRVEAFGKKIPQEKVYLHLDNTCYFMGDTIWYKGYVTRSDNGTLTNLSQILYVELLTPDGYLVERQQLEMTDGTANGAFCLRDSLYAGYYELRAYTLWMLNFGRCDHPHSRWTEEMFYNRRMAKDFFRDYEKLYSRVFPVFDKPDDRETYPKDMTLRPLRRYYKSRKGKPELDVRFYPEGGGLVAGTTGRVAFEANTQEGKHLNLELSIQDRNGKEITKTKTVNRGRGIFTLPDIAAQGGYRAVFRYEGYDYTVDLPKPEKEGCAMTVTQADGMLHMDFSTNLPPDQRAETLGLQIMHNGITQECRTLDFTSQEQLTLNIPTEQFPTGVLQITLFDKQGRIHADRLVFINHHDHDRPRLSVTGLKEEYQPYEPISLKLQLTDIAESMVPNLSVSVRDRATDEQTYDNGNILTEMLLSSELKGFIESPGYYFEADTPERRQALDLLMMVQGWRRYSWKAMAGIEPFNLEYMPEQEQTISGCVNRAEDFRMDRSVHASEICWIPGSGVMDYTLDPYLKEETNLAKEQMEKDAEEEASGIAQEPQETGIQQAAQENYSFFYGSILSNLKKEVNVWPTFIQGDDIVELKQITENGTFYMQTPKFYGDCIMFISAADEDKNIDYIIKSRRKDYTNEEAIPDYFVKLNRFYPVFPKPYSYYQNAEMDEWETWSESDTPQTFSTERVLGTVTVRSKKGGLRKLDLSKPAFVVDAYEAFNLTADYGMNAGTHNWITFPQQIALAYVGDMGMDREFFLQVRYDGNAINEKRAQRQIAPVTMLNGEKIEVPPPIRKGKAALDKYHFLRNLDKVYIYTDYAPREQGSWKYSQDNQPDVTIDLRRFKNEGMQTTYRDRRYVLPGYSVCEEFYSPDYSQKPLPGTKDYRRTLYWSPNVDFNEQGEATINLYNNSSPTSLSIDIEGVGNDGTLLVWPGKE